MKTNELLLLIIFLAGWNLASLSCFAQVNVDESQLIGNWCYESTQTVAVKDGIVGVINSKLIYTYQTNGIVMCQVNINNDVFIDMAGYKNNLKIEFSKTFQGKWSIKKGHILVQKINDPNSSSMNMVIDHEDSFYDKIYLPDIKTIMREALPKQAEDMLKTHKENILSLSETEMVTDKGYYKHSLESASVEGFEGLSAEELMQKGWECSQRGDQEMSFKFFEKAAQQGNSEAQFWTGVNYEMGDGVKENHKKAFFWYTQSANQGNPDGENSLGCCYRDGDGVRKNYTKAIYWFEKAAHQGHSAAQRNMANCYEKGMGVQKDSEKAAYWRKLYEENPHK